MTQPVVLLLSGGLDSTVLLYNLRNAYNWEIHALLFHYGQNHFKELDYAKKHCRFLGVKWIEAEISRIFSGSSLVGGTGSVVVPNRNMVFLSIGAALAKSIGASAVYFAANAEDRKGFPDCRREFVAAMNKAVQFGAPGVSVKAPYINMTKREIVGLGKFYGVKMENTWSCYVGGKDPCRECDACKKREAAFA